MKRKLAVGILSAVLLVGGATAAFGATDSAKLDELKSLTQQMFGIQKQIVDKEVEAGLRTAEQADEMKKFIDQRQQASEEALAEGKVFGYGMMGKGIVCDNFKMFNNGEPMTEEQLEAWSKAAQERLSARAEAMKSNGKLTDDQIKTWSAEAQTQLERQIAAMKKGTFVPGANMGGMGMGMNVRGGHGGRVWSARLAPNTTVSPDSSSAVTQ